MKLAVLSLSVFSISAVPRVSIATGETTPSSPITAAFEDATVLGQIAKELNRGNLSAELKKALIDNARPEDAVPLKALLARYKKSQDLNFESTFHRLVGRDKSGAVVFSAEVNPEKPRGFYINGVEWTAPETGSILTSLRKSVFQYDTQKNSKLDFLIPTADAAEKDQTASQLASQLASYVFVSGNPTDRNPAEGATSYLHHKDVYGTLLRGAQFPQTGKIDAAMAFWNSMTMAPYKVQCTPEGAKGFALVGNSQTEFLVQDDLSVILKSLNNEQAIKFIPTKELTAKRAAKVKQNIDGVKSLGEGEFVTSEDYRKAKVAFEGLVQLCSIQNQTPRKPTADSFCLSTISYGDRLTEPYLKQMVFREIGPDVYQVDTTLRMRKLYIDGVRNWVNQNRDNLNTAIRELGEAVVVRDQTGTLEACVDSACKRTIPADEKSVFGYRIPPNNTEDSVKQALAFKPKSNLMAKIQFSCPTKNAACERMELIGAEGLSGSDLEKGNKLLEAANRSLIWKESDPSVSQPLSILRALGPCCKDQECRARTVNKGADLTPTGGAKKGGVVK